MEKRRERREEWSFAITLANCINIDFFHLDLFDYGGKKLMHK
jgi:hypothetical protein